VFGVACERGVNGEKWRVDVWFGREKGVKVVCLRVVCVRCVV